MPPTPVDEHTEEFEQLAGLSALRVLEGEELALFEQHAAVCERCRLMVRLDREALDRVALTAPEMDPSPDFKARLLRRAAQELEAPEPVQLRPAGQPASPNADPDRPTATDLPGAVPDRLRTDADRFGAASDRPGPAPAAPTDVPAGPRALPPNVVPLWRRSRWISALAAVVVLGIVTAGAFGYENQPVATYQLSGDAAGSAVVVIRRSGAVELEMRGVPDPGPGFIYEAWIIPPGKQPVAAGITARGEATLPLSGDVRGSTVAITKERSQVDAPTTPPLLATVVQS